MSAAIATTIAMPISTTAHVTVTRITAVGRLSDTSHRPRSTLVDCKMTHIYDLTIHGGLLCLIIFTPLAFDSVYPWGIALMEGIVLLMALAWAFKLLHTGRVRLV